MVEDDKKSFADLLADVMSYYGKDTSEFVLNVYWDALSRYDYSAVTRAFSIHAQDPDRGQFCPKPGDVVRLIDGGSGDRALEAWAKVQKACARVGAYRSVVFDDPLIHAVLSEMGSWPKLCQTDVEEMPFRGNEFQKRYRGLMHRNDVKYPKKLLGSVDMENMRDGYKPDDPVMIGNSDQALLVYQSGGGNLEKTQTLGQLTGALTQQKALTAER